MPPAVSAGPTAPGQEVARRPVLPPEIPEFFLPQRKNLPAGASLCYRPALLGTARVHFAQTKSNVDVWENVALTAALGEALSASVWDEAQAGTEDAPELEKAPAAGDARFAPLPSELTRPRKFAELTSALKDHLYRTETFEIWKCPSLKQVSKPGESEGDFRVRLSQAARQDRDERVEKLRAKYAPKLALVQERIRKAQQKVEKEQAQASQQTLQTALSFGSSLLGALFSRKIGSAANVSRAASAARAAGRIDREKQDVTLAQENVQQYQDQLAELDAQFKAETAALDDSVNADKLELEDIVIKPKKADINVTLVALVWMPGAAGNDGTTTPLT